MNPIFDLRLAVRSLAKRPGFSLIVILTMAVGIGANVAVFSYLSYYTLPTIDAPKPREVVRVETSFDGSPTLTSSYPDWLDIKREAQIFEQLAAFRLFGASMKCNDKTLYTWGHAVSEDYLPLFGALPARGRLIQPDDDRSEAEGVVVLNHLFWTRHFDADPNVIGQIVYLNGRHPYTVIGVARPGFQGQGLATEIYIPLSTAGTVMSGLDNRQDRRVQSLGRLSSDVTVEQARAALSPLAESLDDAYPEEEARQLNVRAFSEPVTGASEDPFVFAAKILMAAVVLLLLLACANVANLLLARSESRRREMGVLAALGAGRARLSLRLLFESLILSVSGGLVGLLIGFWAINIIEHYLLQTVPVGMGAWGQATSLVVNEHQLIAFAVGISVVTGLLFGLAPVTQLFRADLVKALKSNASGSRGRKWLEMRKLLVVAQVALSVILLLGAGLLVRTLVLVGQQEVGFEPRNLTLATVYMPTDRSSDEAEARAAYQDLLERTREISGVEAASLVQMIPLSGFIRTVDAALPHRPEKEPINYNIVGPGFFETMSIPLLQGREFDGRDRHDSTGVAIVNQAAATHLWPDRDPIGQSIQVQQSVGVEQSAFYEVVGVAADSRYQRIVDPIRPQVYLNFHQEFRPRLTFVVRSSTPVASQLREGFREQYPDMAIIDLVPFSEQIRRSLSDQRMNADIAVGFGLLGLLLAATGIFSVMSYVVSRRHREFGIRMAIGATASDMSRQVLGEAGKLIGVGLAVGLLSAWALAKILASVLYGVSAHDTLTFVAVPLVLGAIGVLAAFLPARRASRIDPIIALREE